MTPSPARIPSGFRDPRIRCLLAAFGCAVCLLFWQALTVRYSYGGNWTGLFCTGALKPPPAGLASEDIYRVPNSAGYDGQQYHYVAHDPLLKRNFAANMDTPRLRYRRILVPGLAFLLAFGRDGAIDAAYIFVVSGFIFLGAYWLSRLAVRLGYPAASGALFGAAPPVLISVDRLTVDVALASCCVGFALYVYERSPRKLYVVLAAAALARETGLLLTAACVLWAASERRLRRAAVFATAVAPTACWYIFVRLHTPPDYSAGFLTAALFSGLVDRILNPFPYPFPSLMTHLAKTLDALALAGLVGALAWTFYRAFRRLWTPVTAALYLYAILAMTITAGDAWAEAYGFGRILGPLLVLSAVDGMSAGSIVPAAAMIALDPRIVLQMAPQVLNVIRGIAA